MTPSNCDHSASTEENSFPTCGDASQLACLLLSHRAGGTVCAYRDDGLERAVQLVDVGEDVLEALFLLMFASAHCRFFFFFPLSGE